MVALPISRPSALAVTVNEPNSNFLAFAMAKARPLNTCLFKDVNVV
jgi:hypothetical protein